MHLHCFYGQAIVRQRMREAEHAAEKRRLVRLLTRQRRERVHRNGA